MKYFALLASSCLVTSCLMIGQLSAQVTSSELRGSVLDNTGAAVANAKVTASNKATGVNYDTVSDSTGAYAITLLPPGDYQLTVEAAGFRKLSQSGLTLQITQQARVDLTLQLGQVSETIEVSAQAPLLAPPAVYHARPPSYW